MVEMIGAILRAQWLSVRPFRLSSSRRGAVFTVVTAVVWYGFWTVVAAVVCQVTASDTYKNQIEVMLPLGLLAVAAYWQLAPLASATLGASLDLRKLLVYPVPRRGLFFVEVLMRITTCAEMLLLLAGCAIGLLRNPAFGAWGGLPRIFLGTVSFVCFNLLLSTGLRSLLERLLGRKRIREGLILLLVLASTLPQFLALTGLPMQRFKQVLSAGRNPLWPWVAAGRVMLGDLPVKHLAAGEGVMIAWIILAYLFARSQFIRSLRFDADAAQATALKSREYPWSTKLYRLPSLVLGDPLGAMVEKDLRSYSRTPRFRLVFIMGFSFGLMVWLPMALRGHAHHSALADNFLVVVSVYALTLLGQVTYWNAFGFDRSAAQLYFVAPVPISSTLMAKNIAAAIFIFLEIGAVAAACSLLRFGISPAKIAEAFVVTGIAALYLLGLGNLSSVHYPRVMNPQRVSAGGAASRVQGLLLLFYPVALLPVLLAYLARYAFENTVIFYGILALAALLGLAIYGMALESAVHTAVRRRETILAQLSVGEGPVATE
ncbi:MAG: hypothetical protein U0Q18_35270 [Bryobacteraceae bacterium]